MTAIPISDKESKVIVELLKDVTNSIIMSGDSSIHDKGDSAEMKNLLEKTNLQAITDELTQVYNKRYLLEKLPALISTFSEQNKELSIIMTGIDHFKKVNEVENKEFQYNELVITITASFGVCSLTDIEQKEYNELIDCADKSLYNAKQTGRNCVRCKV